MNNIDLSVIVPAFNVDKYIEECLLPFNQNYSKNIEVIVINDGSTDNTLAIIEKYSKNNPIIKILTKPNGGQSTARNLGLDNANGKYLIFLDSDDILNINNVIKMIDIAEISGADIVLGNYYEFYKDKKKIRYDKTNFTNDLTEESEKLYKIFTVDISSLIGNKLYKTDFINKRKFRFKEGYYFEDLEFLFKTFYYSSKIVKVNDIIYGYRQRPGSTMSNVKIVFDKIIILDEIKFFLLNEGKYEKYYELYKILYIKMAFSVLLSICKNSKNVSKKDVIPLFEKVLKHDTMLKMKNEPFIEIQNLEFKERVVFLFIKLGLINKWTLYYLSLAIKMIK